MKTKLPEERVPVSLGEVPQVLTPRWTPLRPHPVQTSFGLSGHRYNVVPSGRRSGKSEIAKRRAVIKALSMERNDGWVVLAAPTHAQAKRIFWGDLKKLVPRQFLARPPRESELTLELVNGCEITVLGLDIAERIEGRSLSHVVIDEYGNMKEDVWYEHVRPALSDHIGSADLIGVPEGRNHYYDLWISAKGDELGEWGAYWWKSADILDPAEIISARSHLDPLTFQQEYEGSFINFQGRVYYNFDQEVNAKSRQLYDPKKDLIWCFDFNVSPGVALVCQEDEVKGITRCINEVYIPRNSNTVLVVSKLCKLYENHKEDIYCYGDATGGATGTAKVLGNDWDLAKLTAKPFYGDRLKFRVPLENPRERIRVNALNSRIKSVDNQVRLMVDPVNCKNLIKDFEGVILLEGGSGEIDKKADERLTHLTDSLGYYIAYEYPIRTYALSSASV